MKLFYIIACVLLAAAIGFHVLGLRAASQGSHALTTAASNRQASHDDADAYARTSDSLTLVGEILACLGLVSWVCSLSRGYRWMPAIPSVLIFLYLVLFFVLV